MAVAADRQRGVSGRGGMGELEYCVVRLSPASPGQSKPRPVRSRAYVPRPLIGFWRSTEACSVESFSVCEFYLVVWVVLDSVLPLYDHAISIKYPLSLQAI